MKKIGILNQPIASIIAGLGHTDTLVIADAGLPIPPETRRIDLALTEGIPSFLDTLRVVLTEMEVERAIVAETVTHLIFKERTRSARAVIRTGEFTPYANVILTAGVVF